ncbi:MAG: hypothetical protein STSR0008_07290 [Ignavibacterium sp.]
MAFGEQHKLIEELKKVDYKIKGKDRDEWLMFLKRNKDEEDFDTISLKRLKGLHQKYFTTKSKIDLEKYFKKPSDNNET